jgi:hypothetical protein
LHRKFLTIDENGQRIFALTASELTVVTLAHVPLGIGTVVSAGGPAAGGTTVTIRGSGFQSGVTLTIGGKSVAATFIDMNTLKIVTPLFQSVRSVSLSPTPTANRSPGTRPLALIERLFALHLSHIVILTFRWRYSSKPK